MNYVSFHTEDFQLALLVLAHVSGAVAVVNASANGAYSLCTR